MRLSRSAVVIVAAVVSLGLTGCGTVRGLSLTPQFGINGTCTTKKGELRGVGSGFTNSGAYQTTVVQPDGKPYPDDKLDSSYGLADEHGAITKWSWPCKDDAAGTYSVTIKDLETNVEAHATFVIGTP